jgi:hypothetical protein
MRTDYQVASPVCADGLSHSLLGSAPRHDIVLTNFSIDAKSSSLELPSRRPRRQFCPDLAALLARSCRTFRTCCKQRLNRYVRHLYDQRPSRPAFVVACYSICSIALHWNCSSTQKSERRKRSGQNLLTVTRNQKVQL